MSSKGGILYKKKLNMDNVPQQYTQALEIASVSKVKNLTAIAKKKEEDALAAAAAAAAKQRALEE